MTADSQKDIEYLKAIGRICAETLRKMMGQVRTGMTTCELDEMGRAFIQAEGARSAPEVAYNYPGATCISVSPVIAHGIPDEHILREGELIHIDVSAELDGYYADTGASLGRCEARTEFGKTARCNQSNVEQGAPRGEGGKSIERDREDGPE